MSFLGAVSAGAHLTNFAGRTWLISDRYGAPGPNEWTNDCVWVDTNGALHLQIKKIGTNWYCGEVQTTNTLGYGEYRWYTVGPVDNMDTNAIGGLFTYESDTNEIDIEFTKCFSADPRTNLHYTVQPYYVAGHQRQRAMALTNENTTHRFVWGPGQIHWQSWYGHSANPPDTNAMLDDWTYSGSGIPKHASEHLFINLWMFDGLDPVETDKLEMIVKDFIYVAATGTLFYDEFADTTMSNAWTVFGSAGGDGLIESNNQLRVHAADVDYESLGYRTLGTLDWTADGLEYVFSSCLSTVSVSRAGTNVSVDVYGLQSFFSAPSTYYDSYWSSNAISLKSGYDGSNNTIQIQLYTKTNWPSNWGNQRFNGAITNANAYFSDTNGLELQFVLSGSNYHVRAFCGTNSVSFSTNSGASIGPHNLGSRLFSGYYGIGAQNEYDGRGYVYWNRTKMYSQSGAQTSEAPPEVTNDADVVEIGHGDSTWRYPLNTKYRKSRIQVLYLTNQIARSGIITQLEMYVSGYPLIRLSNYTIRVQHTAATNLSSSWVTNGWTTVYQGSTQLTATGWEKFTFTNAFSYNGRSNLLVDFSFNNALNESVPYGFARYSIGSYRVCLARSINTGGSPLDWVNTDPTGAKDPYLTNRYVDVRFVFQSASNRASGFELCDEFNDLAMSNAWELSGNWDNAEYVETDGVLRVKAGVNAWQTSAYITTNRVVWNDTNGLYVFAAALSTMRVDAAQSGEDIRSLISICSEKENAWYVTNAASLQGRYDSASDTLTLSFSTKTNWPMADGEERFNGSIPGASCYFGGTNCLQMRIVLGQQKYQLRFADARGQPVLPVTNSGSAFGDHNLGTALHQCYWLIGAQNTEAGRGAVFWDRTFVATSRAPSSAVSGAAQVSTDGQGLVVISNGLFDAEGDPGWLRIDASTNGGASWFKPWITAVTGSYSASAVPADAMQVIHAATTNGLGVAATNLLRVTWDSRHPGNEAVLAGVFTNVRVRIVPDDLSVQGSAVTSAAFALDNEAPSAGGAAVTVEGGAAFALGTSLNVSWSGFTEQGSSIAGYYYALTNAGGTTSGAWIAANSALVGGAVADETNTVYVWAADSFGNLGAAAFDSVLVLSPGGDWDNDGLTNGAEAGYNASPLNPDSDGDSMPDGWEVRYGLDPTGSTDAAQSGDDDGYPNRDEYYWGTDPTSTTSHLLFGGDHQSGGAEFRLVWSSLTGRLYSVYYSDSAFSNGMPWSPVPSCSNAAGVAGMMTWTDQVPAAVIRSFKLGVRLP